MLKLHSSRVIKSPLLNCELRMIRMIRIMDDPCEGGCSESDKSDIFTAHMSYFDLSFSLVLFQPRDIRIVCHGGEMLQQGILSLAIGSHLPFVTVILENGVDLLSS